MLMPASFPSRGTLKPQASRTPQTANVQTCQVISSPPPPCHFTYFSIKPLPCTSAGSRDVNSPPTPHQPLPLFFLFCRNCTPNPHFPHPDPGQLSSCPPQEPPWSPAGGMSFLILGSHTPSGHFSSHMLMVFLIILCTAHLPTQHHNSVGKGGGMPSTLVLTVHRAGAVQQGPPTPFTLPLTAKLSNQNTPFTGRETEAQGGLCFLLSSI